MSNVNNLENDNRMLVLGRMAGCSQTKLVRHQRIRYKFFDSLKIKWWNRCLDIKPGIPNPMIRLAIGSDETVKEIRAYYSGYGPVRSTAHALGA